jgi:hypothetical protein
MNIDIKNLDLEDAKNMYHLSDDMPEFILLTKAKDGRYKVWDSDATLSGIVAKVIIGFKEKKAQFLQKILDIVQ